jgi:YHS domain-containing protein
MDTNFIMFHFLSSKEEVDQFMKYPDDFLNYILRIKKDIKPPMILSPEKIAEILYQDKDEENEGEEEEENQDSKEDDSELNARRNEGLNKFSLNIKYEYQDLCPVDIVENKIKRIGKVAYSMKYNGKYYKFYSMENMEKFKLNPNKYINLELPVRKVNLEQNKLTEKKILFNNTVNFLEFTFGSLITKGMLELSNNRIKYPYLNVKESSLKYLALFLKANNPKNNRYAQEKYKKILKEFKRNSELPWELYHVYENYNNEKENELNKKLIRKQLDTVSVKYDKLMEKAKIQNNTRFANFFRINNETNEEEKIE